MPPDTVKDRLKSLSIEFIASSRTSLSNHSLPISAPWVCFAVTVADAILIEASAITHIGLGLVSPPSVSQTDILHPARVVKNDSHACCDYSRIIAPSLGLFVGLDDLSFIFHPQWDGQFGNYCIHRKGSRAVSKEEFGYRNGERPFRD